ncbi:hypothetical protein RHMOL_Rhmol10G0073400 [Rhododendron molle]|uniref:Uncharacterized protein n=1 Tax=Rhododendron molle TaxID=49168 RepID=A0ACC0M113_RHOML|nr:hypothetical protein RHMOL_Rhmol10G0073400 [Rhododendron molle]
MHISGLLRFALRSLSRVPFWDLAGRPAIQRTPSKTPARLRRSFSFAIAISRYLIDQGKQVHAALARIGYGLILY